MLSVRYAPAIESDLVEAALRYNSRQPGLGLRLLEDFRRTAERIAAFGQVHRQVIADYRRFHFTDFPYTIYFVVHGSVATVYLVIDATRDPALILHMLRARRSAS